MQLLRIVKHLRDEVREMPGVAGVHIMAIGWEEAVAEITKQAGLQPRPTVVRQETRRR